MKRLIALLVAGWTLIGWAGFYFVNADTPGNVLVPRAPDQFLVPITTTTFAGDTTLNVAFDDVRYRPLMSPRSGTVTWITDAKTIRCGSVVVHVDNRVIVAACGRLPQSGDTVWIGEPKSSRFRARVVVGQRVGVGELVADGAVAVYQSTVSEVTRPSAATGGRKLVLSYAHKTFTYRQGSSRLPSRLMNLLAKGEPQATLVAQLPSPVVVSVLSSLAIVGNEGNSGCLLAVPLSSDSIAEAKGTRVKLLFEEPGIAFIEPILAEQAVVGASLDTDTCA